MPSATMNTSRPQSPCPLRGWWPILKAYPRMGYVPGYEWGLFLRHLGFKFLVPYSKR